MRLDQLHNMYRSLLLTAILVSLPLSAQAAQIANTSSNLLSDPGFEPGTPNLLPPGVPGLNRWSRENAELIVGQSGGISPFEGNGMLKLNDSGALTSQVAQFINVSDFAAEIDAGKVGVSLSALYNSATSDTSVSTLIRARSALSFSGDTLIQNFGTNLLLDSDLETWETVSVGIDSLIFLPVGTRFIDAEVVAFNASIPEGAFVDSADLRLITFSDVTPDPNPVPEPSGLLGLAAVMGLGVAINRKSRASNHNQQAIKSNMIPKLQTRIFQHECLRWSTLRSR